MNLFEIDFNGRNDEMKNSKVSETKTENIFRKFYGPETFIEKSAIPKECGFKSKKGSGYKGYPDFFLDRGDYVITVEAKAVVHSDAVSEVKFYMTNNKVKKQKDIIGIAVSGQSKAKLEVSCFYLLRGDKEIKQIDSINTLIKLDELERVFLNKKNGDMVSDEELTTILTSLNTEFHRHKIRDTDRSLFFSGLMIALTNSNFRNLYSGILAPENKHGKKGGTVLLEAHNLNESILSAVDEELKDKINNLSKEFSWKDRFSFIKTVDIPLSEYKEIIHTIETKIYQPFRNNEKLDILGRAYKIFLKKAGKVDNKNIILTPDHVKRLMVKLARLSKDDVVLDTCTGSGGFLMEAMETMIKLAGDDTSKIKRIKEKQLIGFESDNVLFALACTNMFLHKDGRTNMIFGSSLLDIDNKQDKKLFNYIRKLKPTKIIINPPYENNNPILFTQQAIDYLEPNGKLIIIMPSPTLIKHESSFTKKLLKIAKLDFVIRMPLSIFKEQKRTVYTSIFGFTKTPHQIQDEVLFYELEEDGLVSIQHKGRIDKYKRWDAIEEKIIDSVFNSTEIKGVSEKRHIFVQGELMCAGVSENILKLPNLKKFGELFNMNEKGTLQSENAELDGEFDFITAAEKWKKHTEYACDKEAIVYAIGAEGSLGRAHYVNGKFVASNLCMILTPKDSKMYPIDLEFYTYYLMGIREKLVGVLRNGTSKLTIKPEELANYPIEYIEYNEQLRLKSIVQKKLNNVRIMEEKLSKAKLAVFENLSKI